jgi:DNA-binding transcriptional MerR regulator
MLAPQKNRAGQRTYRKRDVEMVLRIKELLYEDQYTIAGAKKKLQSDLRGASKLKVVTPDMNAANINVGEPQNTTTIAAPPPSTPPAPPVYASDHELPPTEPSVPLTDERRAALRRLREQMRDLLTLMDATEARTSTQKK